jgi:pimeloyl-ACP methyl ester carboxylesterase
MLLHGYAQTNVTWHKVAAVLATHFALVIPDLPGYGWSAVPDAGPDHAPYTKRAMAAAMIEVMEALGHARFNLAGHDRGGRVAYRLALDQLGRLIRLATLDIVPTYAMWRGLDARLAYRIWHWTFLALPAPAVRISTSAISPAASRACSAPIGSNTRSGAVPEPAWNCRAKAVTATCIDRAQKTLSIASFLPAGRAGLLYRSRY